MAVACCTANRVTRIWVHLFPFASPLHALLTLTRPGPVPKRMRRYSIRRSSLRRYSLTSRNFSYAGLHDLDIDDGHSMSIGEHLYELYEEIKYFFADLTYANIKAYTVYFLDSFSVNISVSCAIRALFLRSAHILRVSMCCFLLVPPGTEESRTCLLFLASCHSPLLDSSLTPFPVSPMIWGEFPSSA